MDLRQLDKKYFGRQGEPEDVIVGNSADSYLTDARGRKYIDFMMGWCVGNLGWGNTEIRAAARKFDGPEYVHPEYLYRPWAQLAEMLARITPGKLEVSYRTTGGTESVEGALQIAMAYTGRGKFVSVEDSYHGNSIATMSVGASDNRKKFVVITRHSAPEDEFLAIQSGADGYVPCHAGAAKLLDLLRCAGVRQLNAHPPRTAHVPTDISEDSRLFERLSRRELEVLRLVVQAKSSAEIARIVHLSRKTIETYRCRLMKKVGVSDLPSLVKLALQHGITTFN